MQLTQSGYASLLETVHASVPEILEFTQELIAIPSENPPGNEYARCAGVIARKLQELGFSPRVLEVPVNAGKQPGYCVTASHGEGERVLHLHGHYDVVPHSVEGQFHPTIKGDNLFGRGSSDMKGGLASMIFAVNALKRAGLQLNGRVELVIVPDEETGGERGSAWLSRSTEFAKAA